MSALYELGRQKLLEGTIHWLSDTIHVALVDTGSYTPNMTADEFFSAITVPGGQVGTSGVLTGKNSTTGVADAADLTITGVSGSSVEAIAIYKFVTVPADSPLIALITTGTGLPFTPNGGDVLISWDNGSNRIFKL